MHLCSNIIYTALVIFMEIKFFGIIFFTHYMYIKIIISNNKLKFVFLNKIGVENKILCIPSGINMIKKQMISSKV